MAVGDVAVRDLLERGGQGSRVRRAPHQMAHPVRVGGGQQRLAAGRAVEQVAHALRRTKGEQHRLRMGAESAHVAHAVVLLRRARALVRTDQPALVIGGAHAGDDAGLPVGAVLHPVEIERRLPFPEQDAMLLQTGEAAARPLVDPRVVGVDLARQVDLGAHHVQEVAPVALRHGGGLGPGGHVERRRDDSLRLVRRRQPWTKRDDGHGLVRIMPDRQPAEQDCGRPD